MTQYLLTVIQPAGAERPPEDELARIRRDLDALNGEMRAAGASVFSGGLHAPDTATVLRPRDGEVITIDGPFAEGKEYVGGFSIVEAPDLDAALEWGRRLSAATTLPIEVRPFV